MILITYRSREVAQWIEENCQPPSSYTYSTAWPYDELILDAMPPCELTLRLEPVDRMLFDLYFAGWFVRNGRNDKHYDNTEVNRMMIEYQGG